MKKFTEQELNAALKASPKVIQNELATGYGTADIIRTFGPKYNLHIDTLGVIAELNRNMLLGLVRPEEFFKELITAGIQDKDVKEIMTEINQKIFVPLRERMRSGKTIVSESEKSTESIAQTRPKEVLRWGESVPQPPRLAQVIAKVPTYEAPEQKSKYFHLENKIPLPRPTIQSPQPAMLAPTPVANEKLLEDHEEPHIDISNKVQGASLPGTQPPTPVPSSAPLTPYPLPLKPSAPPARPYSIDPYREPIDTL
ncbi:MAG: hypothetical protein V1711_02665 [bacterium]